MARDLFVHIPRTGGTTIEKLMKEHLEGTYAPAYWDGPVLMKRRRDLLEYDHFIGHQFYYIADGIPNVRAFTFLRSPVDRLYSLWAFMLEHNPELAANYDGFMDCARRNPHFQNHQTRFLAARYDVRFARALLGARQAKRKQIFRQIRDLRSIPITEVEFRLARDVLGEMFFVGVFDHFEESVRGLFERWGVALPTPLPNERTTKIRKEDVIDVTDAEVEELWALNEFDRRLYDVALRRWDRS